MPVLQSIAIATEHRYCYTISALLQSKLCEQISPSSLFGVLACVRAPPLQSMAAGLSQLLSKTRATWSLHGVQRGGNGRLELCCILALLQSMPIIEVAFGKRMWWSSNGQVRFHARGMLPSRHCYSACNLPVQLCCTMQALLQSKL